MKSQPILVIVLLSNSLASPENKGDSYNLLGLIDIHQKDDLNSALLNFEKCLEEYSISQSHSSNSCD